jgi:CheY-like chemotaxis protein
MATVLVVEDDEGVRQLVVMILQQSGYDVLWACNGLEALMVYSSYRSQFDLVLTDIDMPQMNGLELAARIRASDPRKKIVLMTGREPDSSKLPENCPVLLKPFLPNQLIGAIDSALKA